MDNSGPPRANAAQLAARKIKEKPKGKRTATGPMRSDHSSPQWSAPSAQPGEGLFGGSVNAPGTFNFSGPSAAPSFPPSTFGNNTFGGNNNNMFGGMSNGHSQNGSDQESDRPIDDRPSKKPFGGFASSGSQQQNHNGFQISNTFGQTPSTSSNLFGSQNPPQGGNNIFFGGTPPTPSGPSFSTTTPAQNQSSTPFTFGAAVSQAPPTPSINFASGTTTDKPANSPFNFGQTSSQPPQSPAPTTSIFNPGTTNTDPKPSFSFGQTSSASSSSSINFGSTPAVASPANDLFGKSQPSATALPANIFGSVTTDDPNPQTTTLFGASTSNSLKPQTSNLFGLSAPSSPKPQTSNLFGSSTFDSPKPQASSIFNNAQPADQPPKNIFADQSQTTTNGTSNPFVQIAKPAQSSSNIFGGSTQAPAAPPMSSEQKSQPASSIFDFNKPSQPQNNMFASPKPQPEQSGNIFANAASTKDLFSSPNRSLSQPAMQLNANGVEKERQKSPEKPATPTSDLFKNLNKPLGQPAAEPKLNVTETAANSSPTKSAPSTNGVFGSPSKDLDQPAARPILEQTEVTKSQQSASKPQSSQGINWAKVDWANFKGFTMEPHNKQNTKIRSLSHDIPPVSVSSVPRNIVRMLIVFSSRNHNRTCLSHPRLFHGWIRSRITKSRKTLDPMNILLRRYRSRHPQ